MGVPIFAALTLTYIYHATLNLPDLPYSHDLRRAGSEEFRKTARSLSTAIYDLIGDLPGEHRIAVNEFRYHQVLGTLVYLDIYAEKHNHEVHQRLHEAVENGKIGNFTLSNEGFVFRVVRDSNMRCSPEEFQCLDGHCIPKANRCDKVRHCPDGSDETAKHGGCEHHLPAIYQTNRIVSVPMGGNIELSATIDSLPENGQVIWARNDEILGQNALSRTSDPRVFPYHSGDQFYIRIENATERDAGNYKISIEGAPAEAVYEVRITPDRVPIPSSDCPEGERACRSGHCLPLSNFCDRTVQCPDGDDEEKCSQVECTDTEMRCESSNVCVPLAMKCDGWKDCVGGEDEQDCPSKSTHQPKDHKHHNARHHHKMSRVTVTCEDGTAPEFSLHGSTYCWSNSVCPTDTVCHQGLCCRTGRNGKRSVAHRACPAGQFRCDSGECIEYEKKCNRKYDCRDGSDEMKCEYFMAVQEFHKSSSTSMTPTHPAVPATSVPSSVPVSVSSVPSVPATQSTSTAQTHRPVHPAVTLSNRNLECTDQEFRCPYLPEVKCFHYDKLCDGIDDCGDGSDETNCESGSREEPSVLSGNQSGNDRDNGRKGNGCGVHEFTCGNGKCVDKRLMCNREYNCDDGTDETSCDYFKESMRARERHTSAQPRQSNQIGGDQGEKGQTQNGAELKRREEELRRREHEERRREEELRRREGEERRREDELRRREEEERRREEQLRAAQHKQQSTIKPNGNGNGNGVHQWRQPSREVTFDDDYADDDLACQPHEFQCSTGECIDKRRVCDTRPDCIDASDEENCGDRRVNGHGPVPPPTSSTPPRLPPPPSYPPRQPFAALQTSAPYTSRTHQDIDADGADNVQITIFPTEAQIREGREVNFDCRARTADNSVYPPTRWTRVGGPLPSHAHESGGRLTFHHVTLGDAGKYVCVASHRGRTVEATANLNVMSYGPQEMQGAGLQTGACMPDEKQCGNNECVKAEYICDGEPDCRDRSDELNCPALRQCEPNEFKCNNQRCVQKMWLCDGDDDCGDNSDETNCAATSPGDVCKSTEFKCHDGQQCVPSSFHCDGTNDCRDGSDEIGCVQPTVVEPPETNKQVPVGSTFSLSCKAVAVPEPYINWRLNWGPVCEPPRCVQTSEAGYGVLTVNNAQPIDQGAYTCEAINVKGRVLATPDCIVRIVDLPVPTAPYVPPPTLPPVTYPPARCDVRGSVQAYADSYGRCECKTMVTGASCDQCRPGAYHLSEKSPQGCLKCFCFGVTDQCRSSDWHRTKERLEFNNDAEGVVISDMEERNIEQNPQFQFLKTGYLTYQDSGSGSHTKYWRLPQRFLGDKVTAYGGKMEFELEFSGSGALVREPMVVLKGNQNILVHKIRNPDSVLRSDSPIRITVETYETNYEQLNGSPATREDLMMVLADLDAFLIRATHAQDQRSSSLGDVSWEIAVDRRTPDGLALEVEQCICPPGYKGTSCEDCAPGYERSGQGPYLGTCVPVRQRPQQACGTGAQPSSGQRCECKPLTTGPNCDQCAPRSFYMSPNNPQGCIPCFCSGVAEQCQSSNYQRKTVDISYHRGDRDQLALTSSDHRQPFSPPSPAYVSGQSIDFSSFHEANGQTLYWKLPEKFLGNKVTAYGGTLKFTFKYNGDGRNNQDPHVILRGNDITLQYTHREQTQSDRENTIEFKILEDKFQRVDGQRATREHLLMALADLDTLLIKATYIDDCAQSSLLSVSLEYAEPYGGGPSALEVEQCVCPQGYIGTSCEDCAPGYARTGGGLYLGLCEKCECHGHANQCHKEYGHCLDCQHNTEGDRCERCKPGFVGDARRGTPSDCQPAATRAPCQCYNHSPRGCDSFGRCLLCEHNTEGMHCERCKKGYYGDATKGTPYDCQPCPCPGASECYLEADGQVVCRNCPAGFTGRLCNECAPGYTKSSNPSGRVCEPIGQIDPGQRTYIGGQANIQQGPSRSHSTSTATSSSSYHTSYQYQQQYSQSRSYQPAPSPYSHPASSPAQPHHRRHRRRRIHVRSRFYKN